MKAGYVLLDIIHGALVIDATRLEKPIQRPSGLKSKQAAEFRESRPTGAVFRGRECFERAMDLLRVDMCFLEIAPGAWEEGSGRDRGQP